MGFPCPYTWFIMAAVDVLLYDCMCVCVLSTAVRSRWSRGGRRRRAVWDRGPACGPTSNGSDGHTVPGWDRQEEKTSVISFLLPWVNNNLLHNNVKKIEKHRRWEATGSLIGLCRLCLLFSLWQRNRQQLKIHLQWVWLRPTAETPSTPGPDCWLSPRNNKTKTRLKSSSWWIPSLTMLFFQFYYCFCIHLSCCFFSHLSIW